MKEDTFTPEQRWLLYESGGVARAAAPVEAAEWHAKAEEAAKALEGPRRADRAAQSAYHLARALSQAERIDEAFAALRRAFSETKPVSAAQLSGDRALDNLRRDPRWPPLWAQLR
jgi:hypothetical protein